MVRPDACCWKGQRGKGDGRRCQERAVLPLRWSAGHPHCKLAAAATHTAFDVIRREADADHPLFICTQHYFCALRNPRNPSNSTPQRRLRSEFALRRDGAGGPPHHGSARRGAQRGRRTRPRRARGPPRRHQSSLVHRSGTRGAGYLSCSASRRTRAAATIGKHRQQRRLYMPLPHRRTPPPASSRLRLPPPLSRPQ